MPGGGASPGVWTSLWAGERLVALLVYVGVIPLNNCVDVRLGWMPFTVGSVFGVRVKERRAWRMRVGVRSWLKYTGARVVDACTVGCIECCGWYDAARVYMHATRWCRLYDNRM